MNAPSWFGSREWLTIISGLEAAAEQYLSDAKLTAPGPNDTDSRLSDQFKRQAEEAKALADKLRAHFGY